MTVGRLAWQLIKFRPVLYFWNSVLWILMAVIPIVLGLLTRWFFDSLTGHAPAHLNFYILVVLLVASNLSRMGVILGAVWVAVTYDGTIGALLRKNMFRQALENPKMDPVATASGEAVSTLRDDVSQIEGFVGEIADLAGMVIFALISLVIMLRINPLITLLVFLPLAGVVIITQLASNRTEQYRKVSRKATAAATGAIGEMFKAVQAIKITGREQQIVEQLTVKNLTRRRSLLQEQVFGSTLGAIFSGTTGLGTGMILLISAQSIRSGKFTVGDLALFMYYIPWVSELVFFGGTFLSLVQQSRVSLDRLQGFIEGRPADILIEYGPVYLTELAPIIQPAKMRADHLEVLEVTNLTSRYQTSGRGVHEVTFNIPAGAFIVVTGRMGAGKTTLLRALLGLLPLESGSICWNGQRVDIPGQYLTPPRVAYTPQVPHLFSDSLRNNIEFGMDADEMKLQQALYCAVLDNDFKMMPDGLETLLGPNGVRLSGGQIQRTAAARMFIRNTELIVLDDISSALDGETEALLWDRISSLPATACLVVSHKEAALSRADNIILLENGRIEAQGTLVDLLDRSPIIRQMLNDSRNTAAPK